MIKNTNSKNKTGFTLVELLIAVAIMGILAAVGIPIYTGYIQSARNSDAQATLQSISMMQEQRQLDNNLATYWTSGNDCTDLTANIATELFGNANAINDDDFFFCIVPTTDGYQARATSRDDATIQFTIDNQGVRNF